MKICEKSLSNRRAYSRLICVIGTILTAISGTVATNMNGLIYFIGYTIMLFFINEVNQWTSDNYYQEEISKLSKRIDELEHKGRN